MTRFGLLLVLLVTVPAAAEPATGPAFDAELASHVYADALAFIAPRALDPVTVPEMTLWGLRGLTSLDSEIAVDDQGPNLRLVAPGRVLWSRPIPVGAAAENWARVATSISIAAWEDSPAIRHAGTQGVITAFFNELFDHLDPYSRYVPPAEAAAEEEQRGGEAGIGVTLMRGRGRSIVVAEAIGDGPGAQAGLRAGDRILAVDGIAADEADLSEMEAALQGPDGSEVVVSLRDRSGRTRTLHLIRADVPAENVFSSRVGADLMVRVTSFTERTASRLANALLAGVDEAHPPRGLVLDLRGNRGGLLRQAIAATDELLPAGIVAMTRGRDPNAAHVWLSSPGALVLSQPLVVLVDGRTASAAEILAAALADRGRAVVVGSSTFGKGLVQIIMHLPDGGELMLTWSRVLAPRGWPIQGLGVLPQVCTSLGEPATFQQFENLAGGLQPMAAALARARAARAPVPPAEVVAIREACPAAVGSPLDLRVARRLLADPTAYATALLPAMR